MLGNPKFYINYRLNKTIANNPNPNPYPNPYPFENAQLFLVVQQVLHFAAVDIEKCAIDLQLVKN
ncbi:hypothetical protein BpHYR1_024494 [Brachionus plicatilis]|uniref:Uncharacterized protein n=1 Tax=Brachionus plicatilis TaxID=10195 RepID=A0A3M7Q6I6_BRAPC|nr:hypothetical protein BpHYR1_024494 [Brachionus plicatilis]